MPALHSVCAAAFAAAAVVAAVAVPGVRAALPASHVDGYVLTPHGHFRADCTHEVPSGSHVRNVDTGLIVTRADGTSYTIPNCDTVNDARPMLLAADGASASADEGAFPADYDGWESYTAFEDKSAGGAGFDSFLGRFSVPDMPQNEPQVLYLFTGLQNIDWIPKVDPLPSTPFDIIQPVLQYPGDWGGYWSVKSWYVTLNAGAVYSPEMKLAVGDTVFGNMTKTAQETWYIGSVSVKTGKAVQISASHPRLASQPWAYNTLECYGCQDCSTYPTKPCDFSQLVITKQSKPVPITWACNPKPAQDRKCHESCAISSGTDVVIGFQ